MPMGQVPGAPQLYLTNTDEAERQAFDMGMSKVTQTHTNLGKVNLKIIQAVGVVPKGSAHEEMIKKLQAYKKTIDVMTKKYETIVQTKRVPDVNEATTSSTLKKMVFNDWECAPPTPYTSHKSKYINK